MNSPGDDISFTVRFKFSTTYQALLYTSYSWFLLLLQRSLTFVSSASSCYTPLVCIRSSSWSELRHWKDALADRSSRHAPKAANASLYFLTWSQRTWGRLYRTSFQYRTNDVPRRSPKVSYYSRRSQANRFINRTLANSLTPLTFVPASFSRYFNRDSHPKCGTWMFTFLLHTEHVKRDCIVIARV